MNYANARGPANRRLSGQPERLFATSLVDGRLRGTVEDVARLIEIH